MQRDPHAAQPEMVYRWSKDYSTQVRVTHRKVRLRVDIADVREVVFRKNLLQGLSCRHGPVTDDVAEGRM